MRITLPETADWPVGDEMSASDFNALVAGSRETLVPPAPETAPDWQTSEKAFQAKVVKYAVERGWDDPKPYHTFDSASSEPGYPDLVMVRVGGDGVGRLIYAELKVPGGRVTKAQRRWLESLEAVRGIEVYLWFPDMWDTIAEVLK